MKETEHNKPKAEIIKNIEQIVANYGFKLEHRGGPYSLQSQLAHLTKSSLYQSLLWLVISFFVIALLISRSISNSFAMLLALVLIMLAVIGAICFKGAIDIMSFPAIFVSLLLVIDIMIRIVVAMRQSTLEEQLKPVLASCLIISLSSTSLYFSKFVPMQNLGFSMIIAMVLAGLVVLIALPRICQTRRDVSQCY
jgi:predicted RND superfamily exporter protein